MYCKLLKLINGENIIVTTDDNCETFQNKEFIDAVDAVEVSTLQIPQGQMLVESYILKPWMKLAASDIFRIPTKSIVMAADLHENAKWQYEDYLNTTGSEAMEFQEQDEQTEDERFEEFLESVLNNEEEDEDGNGRSTKTLH